MQDTQYTGQRTTSEQHDQAAGGIVVPSVACPVSDTNLVQLSQEFNPCGPSENMGQDIYMVVLDFVIRHSNMWTWQEHYIFKCFRSLLTIVIIDHIIIKLGFNQHSVTRPLSSSFFFILWKSLNYNNYLPIYALFRILLKIYWYTKICSNCEIL